MAIVVAAWLRWSSAGTVVVVSGGGGTVRRRDRRFVGGAACAPPLPDRRSPPRRDGWTGGGGGCGAVISIDRVRRRGSAQSRTAASTNSVMPKRSGRRAARLVADFGHHTQNPALLERDGRRIVNRWGEPRGEFRPCDPRPPAGGPPRAPGPHRAPNGSAVSGSKSVGQISATTVAPGSRCGRVNPVVNGQTSRTEPPAEALEDRDERQALAADAPGTEQLPWARRTSAPGSKHLVARPELGNREDGRLGDGRARRSRSQRGGPRRAPVSPPPDRLRAAATSNRLLRL